MVKKSNKKTFNNEYLTQIKNEENNCVELQKKTLHIALHPYQLKEFGSSLNELLSTRIARYSSELGGILLGYENTVLEAGDAAILNDAGFMHINVVGDFYVFKPQIGQLLKGVVNKKSRSHVGCLVFQLFNVALPSPGEDESWLGDDVVLGQEVLFKIVEANLNRKLPYIQGEIISVVGDSDSGISTSEEKKSEEEVQPKKKKKHKKEEQLDIKNEIDGQQQEVFTSTKQKKKNKNKHVAEVNEEESPKKRKKRIKEEILDDEEETIESNLRVEENEETPRKKKKRYTDETIEIKPSVDLEEHSKKHKKKKYSEETLVTDNETIPESSSKKRKRKSKEYEDEDETVSFSPKKKKSKRTESD